MAGHASSINLTPASVCSRVLSPPPLRLLSHSSFLPVQLLCLPRPTRLLFLVLAGVVSVEVKLACVYSVYSGMEGKKQLGSPCPTPPPSSLVADLFGEKRTPSSSSSSLLNSVFPPASSVVGKDKSQPDIPLKKYEVTPGRKTHGSASKGGSIRNSNKNAIYQNEKADPCLFGSSLYYGDRDFCSSTSSSPDTRYNYKKDGEDDSNNSNVAFRGNWWQGALAIPKLCSLVKQFVRLLLGTVAIRIIFLLTRVGSMGVMNSVGVSAFMMQKTKLFLSRAANLLESCV